MINEGLLRRQNILKQLNSLQADACLLSSTVNLYYLNNKIYKGYCYLPYQGEPVHFVRRPLDLKAEDIGFLTDEPGQQGPRLHPDQTHFHLIRKAEQIPEILKELGLAPAQKLMLEGDELSFAEWTRLQECFPDSRLINGSQALRKARSVKTPYEQSLIRKSAELHVASYRSIPQLFRPGMTDLELSIELEYVMRRNGNLGLFRTYGADMDIFMGSVLTGDNASASSPYDFALGGAGHRSNPIGANGSQILPGQSVMIDMAGNFTGYLDDITRCYSCGKLTEKAYKAHRVALELQDRLQERLKEGEVCEDLYHYSLDFVASQGLADCFMGKRQQARFVGHGVGLVINELPVLAPKMKEVLEAGMVLALEPKFVIEGIGAVGIENTFIVGKKHGEKISLLEEEIIDLTSL